MLCRTWQRTLEVDRLFQCGQLRIRIEVKDVYERVTHADILVHHRTCDASAGQVRLSMQLIWDDTQQRAWLKEIGSVPIRAYERQHVWHNRLTSGFGDDRLVGAEADRQISAFGNGHHAI